MPIGNSRAPPIAKLDTLEQASGGDNGPEAPAGYCCRAGTSRFPGEALRARAVLVCRREEPADAFKMRRTDSETVIETLASPRVRLITLETSGRLYGLSHDRLAKVVTAFYEEERARGDLDLDGRVVDLQELVRRRSQALPLLIDQDQSNE
jgi:hypothetical protein